MTSEADTPFAFPGRDYLKTPSMREQARSLKRARSHSALVSRLRIALPILAAGLGGLYFISPKLQVTIGTMDASVAAIVIEKGILRMVNPKLEGANKEKGIYVVTAKYAEQAVANPDLIQLTQIKAEMIDASKGWSRLSAPKGKFETKTEKLDLIGDIRVTQSTGMIAHLTRADVDMKSQIIISKQPVKVTFPSGVLDAKNMHLNVPAREVEFEGDVRVRMEGDKSASETKPAQSTPSFAASFKSDQPVDIAAPKLMIFDKKNLAYFKGGVTTEQAGTQMTSNELKVVYSRDKEENTQGPVAPEKKSDDRPASKLSLIEAIGDVRILTADGRKASAARLIYDSARQELTLDQNVSLTQKNNILTGNRMVYDLAAKITRFQSPGRVHGIFTPSASDAKPAAGTARVASSPPSKPGAAQFNLTSTRGKPIDIESDTLVIFDTRNFAEFKGNVKAAQGKMTMRSKLLKVNFEGETPLDGAGGKSGGSKITTIRAEGKVLINTADDQSTTSDWSVFDVQAQTVTIGGNVVLSQSGNVIKGDQLIIDLKTNRSRIVNRGNPAKRERVRALFIPQTSGADAAGKNSGAR